MLDLLLQITNKQIKNLLPPDTYSLYKYLYEYKLDDPQIKTILSGIKQSECSSDIEQILLSLFFMHKVKIENITHRIYLQEYFPKFVFLVEDSTNINYKLILEYYFIVRYNKDPSNINIIFNEYTGCIKKSKNEILLYNNKINTFLINYNTRQKILKESEDTLLINTIIQYLSNFNIECLYELLEDKTVLNKEINKRKMFSKLKYKIVRESLINPCCLINLKIDKKEFYLTLNRATMIYKDLLDINFKKYIEILKIIKYNKKYVLLTEWLKTFIYFGRFDLFKKLYKEIRTKIPKEEKNLYLTLVKFLKDKSLINLQPFIFKCGYIKDSEFSVHSYKDIILRLS